jgi:hypothetical protein
MKKYTVISLTVGGLANKIFKYGDVVREDNFPKGNAEKLVQQGFLKELESEQVEQVAVVAPKIESFTKAEIMQKLTADGKDFDVRANKQELFDLAYPAQSDEQGIIEANKAAALASLDKV